MTDDLVSRLLAAIQEREDVARSAGGSWDKPGPKSGEQWEWVRSGSDDPLIDQPINLLACAEEHINEGGAVRLQSVEEYPTSSVGPLPHFAVSHAEEVELGPARHIAEHDPASVLRLCQAHRKIVRRYEQAWTHRNDGDPDEVALRQMAAIVMIDVIHYLAEGYGIEATDGSGVAP